MEKGDVIRALTKDESDALKLLREVFKGDESVKIPILKAQDGREIGEEVKMVDRLMHNLVRDDMNVTEVNWLDYAGSYVVADRLGVIGKKKGYVNPLSARAFFWAFFQKISKI